MFSLEEITKEKTGVALGDVFAGSGSLHLPHRSALDSLHSLQRLDYVLIDNSPFFLCPTEKLIEEIARCLVNQGVLIFFAGTGTSEPFKLVHKLLALAPFEFLFEEAWQGGTVYCLRLVKQRHFQASLVPMQSAESYPVRYKIVDRLNEMLGFLPALKRMLKRTLGRA